MKYKKIIPYINAESELESSIVKKAETYKRNGADELFIYNYSVVEIEKDEFIAIIKKITSIIDIPVIIGCHVRKLEDIKRAFYTGAAQVVLPYAKLNDTSVIREGAKRFGNDKILVEFDASHEHVLHSEELMEQMKEYDIAGVLLKHVYTTEKNIEIINNLPFPVYVRDSLRRNDMVDLLSIKNVEGVSTNYYEDKDILKIKHMLVDAGINLNVYASKVGFGDLKKDSDGLVPVVVQDYKNNDVLMLAYMNEEAYNKTIETGLMTYYSRSREGLWLKGETSGHCQYVKSMSVDCDSDTILAKVEQMGAACHTGNRTCFFNEIIKKDYVYIDPLTILEKVMNTINDRKQTPKDGSYTTYLFENGIDKILKKCGEEATEIIIAAKNEDKEDLVYEITDFMYHLMVLMTESGISWDDVMKELTNRH